MPLPAPFPWVLTGGAGRGGIRTHTMRRAYAAMEPPIKEAAKTWKPSKNAWMNMDCWWCRLFAPDVPREPRGGPSMAPRRPRAHDPISTPSKMAPRWRLWSSRGPH
eukprot:6535219-Pyramimonas_sp.AAC.2